MGPGVRALGPSLFRSPVFRRSASQPKARGFWLPGPEAEPDEALGAAEAVLAFDKNAGGVTKTPGLSF